MTEAYFFEHSKLIPSPPLPFKKPADYTSVGYRPAPSDFQSHSLTVLSDQLYFQYQPDPIDHCSDTNVCFYRDNPPHPDPAVVP